MIVVSRGDLAQLWPAGHSCASYHRPYHGTYYHILRLVPVVVHAVFRTPDDGCKENPKHVEEYYSEI
jgi:hypothetical protein